MQDGQSQGKTAIEAIAGAHQDWPGRDTFCLTPPGLFNTVKSGSIAIGLALTG